MITQFEELLSDLGKVFHLKLHIDKQNACTIQIHPQLTVQLQLDITQEHLWIFSKIIDLPPGKFRENILKEALKANSLPDPLTGILSYLNGANQLALYQKYPLNILNGDKLSGFLGAFVEMADNWREAIGKGQTPSPQMQRSNPFGMR